MYLLILQCKVIVKNQTTNRKISKMYEICNLLYEMKKSFSFHTSIQQIFLRNLPTYQRRNLLKV